MHTKSRILLAIVAALMIATAVVLVMQRNREWRERDREFRAAYKTELMQSLETGYYVTGELPTDWDGFWSLGVHSITPEQVDAMVALGYERSSKPHRITDVQEEVFVEALAAAQMQQEAWAANLRTMREPLVALEGDLEAQLRLMLDPEFNPIAALAFLERIRDEHDVPETTLEALVDAAYDYRQSLLMSQRPVDPNDYYSMVRARTPEDAERARVEIERLIGEVMATINGANVGE